MLENTEKSKENKDLLVENKEIVEEKKEICPVCGSHSISKSGRCTTCYTCGYSLCSM